MAANGMKNVGDEEQEYRGRVRQELLALRQLIKLFDQKLKTAKDKHRNLVLDFSGWQAIFQETKREVNDVKTRMSVLEEQQEELDLTDIEGKQQIQVADIISCMKTLQSSILAKTVSHSAIDGMKGALKEFEENLKRYDKQIAE